MKQTDSVSGMKRLAPIQRFFDHFYSPITLCNAFATCFGGASIVCTAVGRLGPADASSSVTSGIGSAMRPLLRVPLQQACSIA